MIKNFNQGCFLCGDEILNKRNAVIHEAQSMGLKVFCTHECFEAHFGAQTDEELMHEDAPRLGIKDPKLWVV